MVNKKAGGYPVLLTPGQGILLIKYYFKITPSKFFLKNLIEIASWKISGEGLVLMVEENYSTIINCWYTQIIYR